MDDIQTMNFKGLVEKYSELLEQSVPSVKPEPKTFLEIGNLPHYENVISNYYCFYFDKEEEHQFNELFLKSICQIIKEETSKDLVFDSYDVLTEVSTKKNGRIDLLIAESDGSKAIIIENKIYHSFHNDINDYWLSVSAKPKNKVGVVLTLEPLQVKSPNYINITHRQLLARVKKNLGSYIDMSNDRHLLFLKDFIRNIQNLTSSKTDMKDSLKFYFEHKRKIHELYELREQGRKHFLNSVKETARILEIEMENSNPKDYRCLIVSEDLNIRYWIQLDQSEEDDFVIVWLDLYDDSKDLVEDLIADKEFVDLAEKKEITVEISEEAKNGISIAHKKLSLSSDDFVNLGKVLAESIKTDWKELTELVKLKFEKAKESK